MYTRMSDYARQYRMSLAETQETPAVTPVVLQGYCALLADSYAHRDGLTLAEYVSKLILRDQYERADLAALE